MDVPRRRLEGAIQMLYDDDVDGTAEWVLKQCRHHVLCRFRSSSSLQLRNQIDDVGIGRVMVLL
ncbi:uncharacterized protein DS421_19g639640 [Arachis hypogaea]|uniref:Uncharacterized protein n=1 Tax=Arachis hypogaea TaxID=3818 RepID=A0A6B9V4X5_ARAHY|nr:uncharacterized protein DS421_19g639640 [Arachis hypogaea]